MIFFGTKVKFSNFFILTIFFFLAVATAHFYVTRRFDLPILFGDRSEALFDLWSFQHFCAGILLGSILLRSKLFSFSSWKEFVLAAFFFSLCWEITELAMENGLFGLAIAHWKDGFEHWGNRFISDSLMVISGELIARHFPQSWKIVLLPVAIWLLINITSPNTMYIQHLLFG